jgi:hypothetical protein
MKNSDSDKSREQPKTVYYYIHNSKGVAVTVGIQEAEPGLFLVASTICSPHDNASKAGGRVVVDAKLDKMNSFDFCREAAVKAIKNFIYFIESIPIWHKDEILVYQRFWNIEDFMIDSWGDLVNAAQRRK